MNYESILIGGFAATILLTTMTVAAQSLGLTRMDIPFILGTMFTPDRDRAKVIGVAVHLVNGWAFALVYALLFLYVAPTWWLGAIIGIVQGFFVCVVVLPTLPGIHPRMVSDSRGPEPTRLLEPPGFLATNYGRSTPVVIVISHGVYGAIVGALYLLQMN